MTRALRLLLNRLALLGLVAVLAACEAGLPTAPSSPTISAQPLNQTVASGGSVTLTVAATGTGALNFQWYVGQSGSMASPVSGATAAGYTTPALTSTSSYWVRVTDTRGAIDSATATITVIATDAGPGPGSPATGSPPFITRQPLDQSIQSGATATLSVEAAGSAPLSYQWYFGSRFIIEGETSSSVTVHELMITTSYWVRVSNAAGSVDSYAATLTVAPAVPTPTTPTTPAGAAPSITGQPQNNSISSGQTALLGVTANGTDTLRYQWYVGASGATGAPIGGAIGATYTTPALTSSTSYWVRVTNDVGVADSQTATVTVTAVVDTSLAFEDQVLVLVNQRRAAGATCGGTAYPAVGALSMNTILRTVARAHSQDMATQNYVNHTSLDGRSFDTRMRDAGYNGAYPWAENIAAGSPTPQAVVDGWMASSGHCANIMDGSLRAIGVGYAKRIGSTYTHYWTQDFGGS